MDLEHWLKPGERLFISGSPGRDGEIATRPGERMYRMKEAFKSTADLLVIQTGENFYERRNLVWPIVFCYRQYIELALKDTIAKHGSKIEPPIDPIWNIHDLGELWKKCKIIIEATLSETAIDEIPEIKAMNSLIDEFESIDSGHVFRYPTDRKGQQNEISMSSIDLVHLQQIMQGVFNFLDANEAMLDAHFGGLP